MHHERIQKVLGTETLVALEWHSAPLLTGIEEFETFEEWNPDPEMAAGEARCLDNANTHFCFFVQGAARPLYGHVNNLELYICYPDPV